jgi:hypothetical protein
VCSALPASLLGLTSVMKLKYSNMAQNDPDEDHPKIFFFVFLHDWSFVE